MPAHGIASATRQRPHREKARSSRTFIIRRVNRYPARHFESADGALLFGADFCGLHGGLGFRLGLVHAIPDDRRGRGCRLAVDDGAFLGSGVADDSRRARSKFHFFPAVAR